MRDLAFDIRARDKTQGAFDAATRNARAFGKSVDQAGAGAMSSARMTDRLTESVNRYGRAVRMASAANDNWRRNNLRLQLFDVGQMLALGQNPMLTLMQQGPQIAQIWGPEEGGVGRAFRETGAWMLSMVTKFPVLTGAAAAAGIAVAGMTHEINAAGDASVSMADVALASFQVIRDGLWSFVQPAVAAIAPWFAAAWDMVVVGVKWVGNTIINSFHAALIDVEAAIFALPDAFIVAGEAAANGFLKGIGWMVREAVVMINDLLTDINGMARKAGLGDVVGLLDMPKASRGVDLGGAAARERLGQLGAARNRRIAEIMGSDPLGAFYDAVKGRAIANSLADVEDKATGAGKAMKDLGKDGKKAGTEVSEALRFARDVAGGFLSDLRNGLKNGEGFWASFRNAGLNALDKIADRLLNSGLDALFGISGGGGFRFPGLEMAGRSGGGIGGFFRSILGFARGGTILPGGGGGVDSQLVMFRKSPNERVDITNPGQGLTAGGRSLVIQQSFTFSGAATSDELKAHARQMAASAVEEVKGRLPEWQTNLARDGAI